MIPFLFFQDNQVIIKAQKHMNFPRSLIGQKYFYQTYINKIDLVPELKKLNVILLCKVLFLYFGKIVLNLLFV